MKTEKCEHCGEKNKEEDMFEVFDPREEGGIIISHFYCSQTCLLDEYKESEYQKILTEIDNLYEELRIKRLNETDRGTLKEYAQQQKILTTLKENLKNDR